MISGICPDGWNIPMWIPIEIQRHLNSETDIDQRQNWISGDKTAEYRHWLKTGENGAPNKPAIPENISQNLLERARRSFENYDFGMVSARVREDRRLLIFSVTLRDVIVLPRGPKFII